MSLTVQSARMLEALEWIAAGVSSTRLTIPTPSDNALRAAKRRGYLRFDESLSIVAGWSQYALSDEGRAEMKALRASAPSTVDA